MNSRSIDKGYAKRAGVLTLVSLVAKVLGALYRIPLTNIIGAEGVGLYQLIFSIYALAIALTSAFSSTLISRQVSTYLAMGDESGAKGYFLIALTESFLSALAVSAILFLFGDRISSLQGAPGGGPGYRVIAPAVMFVALLSSLKGWFNGNMNLTPSALAIVIEQGVKLSVGILLASLYRDRGAAYACAAALGGVTLSEGAAVLTLALLYAFSRSKAIALRIPLKRVLREGFPLRVNGLIMPAALFVDGILIVRLLAGYGMSGEEAVASYGIFSGAINSLVNFPVVLVLSLAIAVIPLISRSKARRDIDTLKGKALLTVKLSLVVSFPCALALTVLAPQAVRLLYPVFSAEQRALAAELLAIGAGGVIFLSLGQIYSSLLQAIDRASDAAQSLALSMTVRLFLILLLVPRVGIVGLAVAGLLSNGLTMILNIAKWLRYTGKSENAMKTLASVTASGGIMLSTILAPVMLIGSPFWSLIISALIGSAVYVIAVLKLKVFSLVELRSMPLSSVTTRIWR